MKKKKNRWPHKPNRLLYALAVFVVYPYFKLRYRMKIDRQAMRGLKGPMMVVANHGSNIDFLCACLALYPRRMNIVTSNYFFQNKWLAPILHFMGAIPKRQFVPDSGTIRGVIGAIKQGGNVLLFPSGQVLAHGVGGFFPPGLGKLLKSQRVPVVTVRIQGAYLSLPKWAKHQRFGQIHVTAAPLYLPDQLEQMSAQQVQDGVEQALAFNEYAWQKEKKIVFRGRRQAEGLQNILMECPRCGAQLKTIAKGNELICAACANTAVLDTYGFLHPKTPADVALEDPQQWYSWQEANMRKRVQEPGFRFACKAELRLPLRPGRPYEHVGEGVVYVDGGGLGYRGTLEGNDADLYFPAREVATLPFSTGDHFEIPSTETMYCFYPEQGQAAIYFVMALNALHANQEKNKQAP